MQSAVGMNVKITNPEGVEQDVCTTHDLMHVPRHKSSRCQFNIIFTVMSTYTQIIYQIVFGTKDNKSILTKDHRAKLFEYILGILSNNKCHVYCINGVEDHIHIVCQLHPTVGLAWLVKDIKLATSAFIKEKNLLINFKGWQVGYGAFTYSIKEKQNLIAYVNNQEEHHKKTSFREEYIRLLNEHGVEFDERYLF
jgi:putative transposase